MRAAMRYGIFSSVLIGRENVSLDHQANLSIHSIASTGPHTFRVKVDLLLFLVHARNVHFTHGLVVIPIALAYPSLLYCHGHGLVEVVVLLCSDSNS